MKNIIIGIVLALSVQIGGKVYQAFGATYVLPGKLVAILNGPTNRSANDKECYVWSLTKAGQPARGIIPCEPCKRSQDTNNVRCDFNKTWKYSGWMDFDEPAGSAGASIY